MRIVKNMFKAYNHSEYFTFTLYKYLTFDLVTHSLFSPLMKKKQYMACSNYRTEKYR